MARILNIYKKIIEKDDWKKHIQNIYKENELSRKATSSILELVQNESGRTVKRNVDIYDITKGYTINRKRIVKNYGAFMKAVADIQEKIIREYNNNRRSIQAGK